MPIFDIEFEVYCSCGAGLCNQSHTEVRRGISRVTVEPCSACLEKAKDRGEELGYNQGIKESEKE